MWYNGLSTWLGQLQLLAMWIAIWRFFLCLFCFVLAALGLHRSTRASLVAAHWL